MPRQIHSYCEEAERYLNSMIDEYERLERNYESLQEDYQISQAQLEEQRNRDTENLPTSGLTEQELQGKIQKLEILVIELTQRLEEKIDVESD